MKRIFSFNFQLRQKLSTVIINLYVLTVISEEEDENYDKGKNETSSSERDATRGNKILDPNDDSKVWCQIQAVEETPALKMTWSKTKSNERWMKMLKIDPNNMVRYQIDTSREKDARFIVACCICPLK